VLALDLGSEFKLGLGLGLGFKLGLGLGLGLVLGSEGELVIDLALSKT
jgi:hypothetical protein